MNVFLTGASSGIGAAMAREFGRRGARLGLVARRADALRQLADEMPGRCDCYPLDVTDHDALIAAAQDFEARCGGTDIVVANAGISTGILTEHQEDLAGFERVIATNLIAAAATFIHSSHRCVRVGAAPWSESPALRGSADYPVPRPTPRPRPP